MAKEKIPLSFVRAFLSARGRKSLYTVYCSCDAGTYNWTQPEHPIRWLWEHAKLGHSPGFDASFCWDTPRGRDPTEYTLWSRWYHIDWNQKESRFRVTTDDDDEYEVVSYDEYWHMKALEKKAKETPSLPPGNSILKMNALAWR